MTSRVGRRRPAPAPDASDATAGPLPDRHRPRTSLDNALRVRVYLSDMKDFAQRLAAASGLAAALALLPATASAAPINVPCSSESNSNVLQNAVLEANASPGPDTIELAEGCTYTFFQGAFQGGGWFGLNALPAIASEITIEGNGATLSREERSSAASASFSSAPIPRGPRRSTT